MRTSLSLTNQTFLTQKNHVKAAVRGDTVRSWERSTVRSLLHFLLFSPSLELSCFEMGCFESVINIGFYFQKSIGERKGVCES